MNLRNCSRCGRVFVDNEHKLCPDCLKEEEENFIKVKEYLWDNPHATIDKVSQETGVKRELIIKFVKEDRLIAKGIDVDISLECERCGTIITHGRYCKKCQQELVAGFSGTGTDKGPSKEENEKESGEMHLKDRIKRYNKRN